MISRIKEIALSKGTSLHAISKKIKVSGAYFTQTLKNKGVVSSVVISRILTLYPDISPEWLLTGRGNMLRDGAPVPLPLQNINGNNHSQIVATQHSGAATYGNGDPRAAFLRLEARLKATEEKMEYLKKQIREKEELIRSLIAQHGDLIKKMK